MPRDSCCASEPFSPRALGETVGIALAARADNKAIKAEITIARDLPAMVSADVLRLRAALENLADNAVKFTHEGTVTFTVSAEPAPRGRVRLIFTFADSGIGMSASELKHLFRPFAQASVEIAKRYGGAGLGLSFVKRIAKAMGGDLTVTSSRGRGSTFPAHDIGRARGRAWGKSSGSATGVDTVAVDSLRRGQSLRPRRDEHDSSASSATASISSRPARRRWRPLRVAATTRC